MTGNTRTNPPHNVFWLTRVTPYPDSPDPGARLVFDLAPEDESPSSPGFQLYLGGLLHIIDKCVVNGAVPAWRDKGHWRKQAGSLPRCGEQMRPEHETMLDAIATRNRNRGSKVKLLIRLEVFDSPQTAPRIALVPVSVFLQCLCAAATLGAVPPLDPNWVRVAIPDWIVASVGHQAVTDGK